MNNVKIENHGVIPKEEEQATPEELYGRLIDKIKHYHPSADELHMIEKAYNFAKNFHGDQKRKSGEPYIIHPLHTALILADLESVSYTHLDVYKRQLHIRYRKMTVIS